MTYPLSFRQQVLAHKEKKALAFEQTSDFFDAPIRTLLRWQGQLEPCTHRNKPTTKINMQALAESPMPTWPKGHSAVASAKTVLGRCLNVSRKKTLHHPKADERQRREFHQAIPMTAKPTPVL